MSDPVAPAPAGDSPGPPTSPRSPRTVPAGLSPPTPIPPGTFIAPPPPRPNLGSMLFLTAFFFFMSGNNNVPQPIAIDEDGKIVPRVTELDVARQSLDEYRGWLNGTSSNWTESAVPVLRPERIMPSQYDHPPVQGPFFTNITGFYRHAVATPLSLVSTSQPETTTFFGDTRIPNLNTTTWNETLAEELKGSWDWAMTNRFDFNLKERFISDSDGHQNITYSGWTWVKGGITLFAESSPPFSIVDGEEIEGDTREIEYEVYGLHHIRNGTYRMFGMPEGKRVDLRRIPTLFENEDEHDLATRAVLLEMEKELKHQQENLLLMDAKEDTSTLTSCPILVYMTVPPLPHGTSPLELERYEEELLRPTGIRLSLPRPPNYWDGVGLGGVIVADQCGVAIGFEKGKGVRIDDFWRKSINYATFSGAIQLALLLLLVRQMESTRTPSVLSGISVWTMVIFGVSDSWIFSAHVVMGLLSDNKASIALLVPGFFGFCSAVIFASRYCLMLHAIQAPERVIPPAPARVRPAPVLTVPTVEGTATTAGTSPITPTTVAVPEDTGPTFREFFFNHPGIRLIGGIIAFFVFLHIAFLPSVVPFFLFALYGFWVPQIYRNAMRGTIGAFDHTFIFGSSLARLGLPLYIFACPDNIFFVNTSPWVWVLPIWLGFQIGILLAQERFGPAFFLPARFQPADSYNYHPLLDSKSSPESDPEAQASLSIEEKTCSICMEEVDTTPGPSSEVLLGMNRKRSYAVAPCHHLFHTRCLAQWLAIKTICPLCKRSLPPL